VEAGITVKLFGAIAGFFGGLSLSFFFQPAALHKHGQLTAGMIIGGISVAASFTLGGVVCRSLGLDGNDIDTVMGVGFSIGLLGVGVIGFVGNFFSNREGKDILEVATELRDVKKAASKPTTRKAPIRRKRNG
jgi:hypothetical protein